MGATFAAVTGVAFQRPAFPGVATSSDAEAVRNNVTAAIRHALEATDTALGTRARSMLQEAVDRDLKLLASLNLGIYPEIGKVLEPMENGPLGALWPMGQPEGLRSSVSTPALDQQPLLPSTPEPPHARNEIKLTAPEAVRTPCPPTLCRYLRPDRLVQALREHRFYCAKLSSFNDPFDGQILSHYPFGKEALLDAVRVELNSLLESGDIVPASKDALNLQGLVHLFQQGVLEGMTSERFIDSVITLLDSQDVNFGPSDFSRRVIPRLADRIRVLCLSQEYDNLLLWSHYSAEHRGGVIQLKLDSDITCFSQAQPIRYCRELPPSGSPADVARGMLGLPLDRSKSAMRQVLSKSEDWAYEKEWRVLVKRDFLDNEFCVTIYPEDIEAIHLGCRMALADKRAVLDLVLERYPNVAVYQAIKDDQAFRLNLIPIHAPRSAATESEDGRCRSLTSIYEKCLRLNYRFWNDPTWNDPACEENLAIETLRLEVDLGQHSTLEIRDKFRRLLDELRDTAARVTPAPAGDNITPEMQKAHELRLLKPSAVLYHELRELATIHLKTVGGVLPSEEEVSRVQAA